MGRISVTGAVSVSEQAHCGSVQDRSAISGPRLWRLAPVFFLSLGMLLLVLFCLGWNPSASRAAGPPLRYVAPTPIGNNSGNDCGNVYRPCATVQYAVGQAAPGDEIRVAAGVYTVTMNLNKNLTLRGGFTITNWTIPDPVQNRTVLDARGGGRVVLVPSGVVAAMSGFHLTGGYVDSQYGGGVYNNGDLTVEDCWIYGNRTAGGISGGGVAVGDPGATLVLRRSWVYSNAAGLYGGGVGVVQGTVLIEATGIFSNSASNFAGGVVVLNGDVAIRSSLIYSNSSGLGGGGIAVSNGSVELVNDTICGNRAVGSGGGIYAGDGIIAITNSLIVSNTAVISGGGIYSATIGSDLSVNYTDFFGNSPFHVEDAGGSIDPTALGSSNVVRDPLFVDPQSFDLHLSSGSPAINTGAEAPGVTVDFEGNGRPFGPAMDRGGDEYTGPGTCYARLESGTVFTTVQEAVDAAADGDVVQVAGLCSGASARVSIVDVGLTLRGGYTVTDWANAYYGPTTLDALGTGRVIYITGTSSIDAQIENFRITGGGADYGAGVYLGDNVTAVLQNNVIDRNAAANDGGGVYIVGSADALLQHNTIYSNTAAQGGGVYVSAGGDVAVASSVVVSNSVSSSGGGIFAASGATSTFEYNDFYGNSPDDYDGLGVGAHATDISAPPGFVDPEAGDFHLTLSSPAVDAADPASTLAADFEGESRPLGARSDMGADESRWYTGVDLGEAPNSPLPVQDLEQIRGRPITFTHTITNVGNSGSLTDTFVITYTNSDGWEVVTDISSPVVLTAGVPVVFNVVISVPVTVADPVYNRTTITATSETNPTGLDVVEDVIARLGLVLAPSYTANADPGEVVTYTHTLTNTGPTDTFTITFSSSRGWGQLLTPVSVTLSYGETALVVARVSVPATTPAYYEDLVLIRATSSYSIGIFAVVTDTTIANPIIGDRYVDTTGIDTDNNCTQEDSPCATIGHAVNQSAWGDVFVARGVYYEADISVGENVSLRGGYLFDGDSFNLPSGEVDPADTVIDAQGSGRGLHIHVPGAYHPVFKGFTIRNAATGGVGGGIYIQGSSAPSLTLLAILDSSANLGGGIYIDTGSPVLQDVTISNTVAGDRGGGIYVNGGSPVIEEVTISGATADGGGGIYVAGGNATVQASRISGNTASVRGGGVCQEGGTLNLWNSFVYSNTATTAGGGGVYKSTGTLNLINNTLFGNQAATFGGGVFDTGAGTSVISNTITVSNTAATGGGIYRGSGGGSLSNDYNDLWGNTASSFPNSNVPAGPHDVSADPLFVDAAAGDLHLAFASPCIDFGDPATFLGTDIDGDARPSNQGFDIGADELVGCQARVVNPATQEQIGPIHGVLQDAIDAALDGYTVQVSGICRGVKTRLVGGRVISQTAFISKSLTLAGGYNSQFSNNPVFDPEPTVFDARSLGRVLMITGSLPVTISRITLTGGDAAGLGGGPGDFDAGGGAYNRDGLLLMEECAITGSHAVYGGGIYNAGGSTVISRTLLDGNTATGGGGIYNGQGLFSAWFSDVQYNQANTGGGLYNAGGAHLSLQGNVILSNTASTSGGGLHNAATGVLTLTNTIVAHNVAESGDGGGLHNVSSRLTVRHDTFYANSAGDQGGGIYHDSDSILPIINSTLIVSNTAGTGSGIYNVTAGAPHFDYNDVYGNDSVNVSGIGNISADPDFFSTDPASVRFLRINLGSPAEDAGDPASPVDMDIDQDPRPSNRSFDIGADEVGGCYVRVNGQPPTYGSVQIAAWRSSQGDTLHVAGICQGVNTLVDGGQTISQTLFLTQVLTVQGGYTLTNWTAPDPIANPTVLDALGMGRVVYVTNSVAITESAQITIAGLHLRGGTAADGGALFAGSGVLTVTESLIYSNTATNGGVLYNQGGSVYLVRNGIFTNTAEYGGVAYSAGGVTVLDGNDVRGNQATVHGGALYHDGGTAYFYNNVVRHNQADAGGGIYNDANNLAVWHNTFYSNTATTTGGGFHTANSDPELVSNLFVTNTASTGGDAVYGAVSADYNDVFPPGPGAYGGGASAGAHSLSVDPLFVDVAAGDFHLQDNSPVIDRGDPAMTLLHDFEEHLRPADQGFDMGADEREGCWARIERTGVIYGNPQRAIAHSIPGDVIQVSVGECRGVHPYDDAGDVVSQTIHITHGLTLWGGFARDFASGGESGPQTYPDPAATTINPMGLGRALYVPEGITVTLNRFILVNGDAGGLGGGPGDGDAGGLFYYAGDRAVLWHVDFYSSTAAYGGALFDRGEDFTMHNSWINFNHATSDGGAIYNAGGAISITVAEDNLATRFYANTAEDRGGGIYNDTGRVLVQDNNVNIDFFGGEITLNDAGEGGFLYNNSGQVRLVNNTIFANNADDGGAIYNNTGTATLLSNELYRNGVTGGGGGLYNAGTATLDYGNRLYENDSDADGAAIYNSGALTVWNTLVYSNTTVLRGAGIYNAGGNSGILHNTFYHNIASDLASQGGAVYVSAGSPTIKNNIFDVNDAAAGDAIYAAAGGSGAVLDYNDYWVASGASQVGGSVSAGSNSFNFTPSFVDAGNADFHLGPFSFLLDVAQSGLGVTHDFEDDPRPINTGPDVGADEHNACLAKLMSTQVIYGQIQEAIDDADPGDVIRVAEGRCEESLYIDGDITISGSWKKDFSGQVLNQYGDVVITTTVHALYLDRVVTVYGTASSVDLSYIDFAYGMTGGNGGGIWSAADVFNLSDSYVSNSEGTNGGGVYVESGSATLDEVDVYANTATDGNGGGVYVNSAQEATISNSSLFFNEANDVSGGNGNGGGLYCAGGTTVHIGGGSVWWNDADDHGGGIYHDGVELTVTNIDIEDNDALGGSGGGIYVINGDTLEMTNVSLYGNTAQVSGGGLYRSSGGTAHLYHNTIHENEAVSGSGGGVYNAANPMTINASIVAFNQSASGGSGVHGAANVTIDHTMWWTNTLVGFTSGGGNVEADPLFLGTSSLLRFASPAIDILDVGDSPIDYDAFNNTRPQLCGKDMGYQEYAVGVRAMTWITAPLPSEATVAPGGSFVYSFRLRNDSENWINLSNHLSSRGPGTGFTETVDISLESSKGWAEITAIVGGANVVIGPGGLTATVDVRPTDYGPGEMVNIQVRVTVPLTAYASIEGDDNTKELTRLSYQARQCPGGSARNGTSNYAKTSVAEIRDFLIGPDYTGAALPGQTLTFTHVITNIGNITDTYDIIPKGGFYAAAEIFQPVPPAQITLSPNQTATIAISVTINLEVAGGVTSVSNAIARSTGDPDLSRAAAHNIAVSYTTGTRYVSLDGQDSLDNPDAPDLKDNNCTQPNVWPCRTIQHAIDQAAGGDLIKIDQGVYTDVVTTTHQSQVVAQIAFVDESVTLQGGYDKGVEPGWDESPPSHFSHTTTLDPESLGRALYVVEGITVTVDRLAIRNGEAGTLGGGPSDEDAGGGLYNEGANLTLNANRIYYGNAELGGGVYHDGGDLLLLNNLFHDNTADDGGAVYVYSGTATLLNDTFHDNQAAVGTGGAVYVAGGDLVVMNTIFANNVSGSGAVHGAPGTTASLDYNLYHNNTVTDTSGTIPTPPAPHDVMADPAFVNPGDTPPDLHLQQSSPAREAGDPATDVGLIPLDYDNNPRRLAYRVDIGAHEYIPEPRVYLEPDHERLVSQGTTIIYTHTLTNGGDLEDVFTLVLSSTQPSWATLLTSSPITLSPGLTATVEVSVTVPSEGVGGLVDVSVVRATSLVGGPAVFDTAVNTTTVEMNPGVAFAPDRAGSADPGVAITYTHTLTNQGDGPDVFALTHHSDLGWVVTHDATVAVGYGMTATVVVSVTVPSDAISGTIDMAIITATSSFSTAVSASVVDTTTVNRVYGVGLVPNRSQAASPEDDVVYQHTLTNLGNYTDTFTLAELSTEGWPLDLSPPGPVTLAAWQTATIVITVSVPYGTGGLVDDTTITAERQDAPLLQAVVTDTTTVGQVFSVALEPDHLVVTDPDLVITYTHTLTNTGNGTDSFTITVASILTWPVELLQPAIPIELTAGQTATVMISLTVPADTYGQRNETIITVESQKNPGTSDTATDVAIVGVTPGLQFEPDCAGSADPGVVITYTHTLTNEGNGPDVFTITHHSDLGWVVTHDPTVAVDYGMTATVVVSVTVPANAISGTVDTAVITATSSWSTTVSASVVDTTTVNRVYGVGLVPNNSQAASPGDHVVYQHTLTNLGNYTDTFTLAELSSQGWPLDLSPPGPVTLAAWQTATLAITVSVPGGTGGFVDYTTVTAARQDAPLLQAVVTDTTTVGQSRGVIIAPDHSAGVNPNTVVTYTHTVTNTGNGPDTFVITFASSQGWPVALLEPPTPISLNAGQTATVVISLTVLSGPSGTTDETVITASAQTDPGVFDTATDTTVIGLASGVLLEPDRAAITEPDVVITYTHTVTNTGNGADSFRIEALSGLGWPVIVLQPLSPVALTVDQTATVVISLTVPPGTYGLTDVTVVTATSESDESAFDTVNDTTTVSMTAGVELTPNRARTAYTGTFAFYTHVLTNAGNGPDTFDLTYHSSQGWAVSFDQDSVYLLSGETHNVVVSVFVPSGAISGTVDTTIVTVTSRANFSVSARVTDTTTAVARTKWLVYLPLVMRNYVYVPPPDGPDLVITGITLEDPSPVAGVPTTVYVMARNQGTLPVQPGNNFYVDFYVDRLPAPLAVGDLEWGVQGSWFGVGDTVVLTGVYTFTAGTHALYAQADTDNTIVERYEDNNVFGPMTLDVGGGGALEVPIVPEQIPEGDRPRPTPTPRP